MQGHELKPLKAILENIYRKDRLQAAKQAGVGEYVTVTYQASQGGKRKRKWRRISLEANDPQGLYTLYERNVPYFKKSIFNLIIIFFP